MELVLMFPYWSIWAPPRKPTSTKPRWAKRNASVMPGSIVARRPARISLVEMGRKPGAISGPMMPPSMTMVRRGAWRCLASAAASRGTPTPAKTVVSSRSSREAMTASNSEALQRVVMVMVAERRRPARGVGGLVGARVDSSGQVASFLLLCGQAGAAEQVEVVVEGRRAERVALEIVDHGVRSLSV